MMTAAGEIFDNGQSALSSPGQAFASASSWLPWIAVLRYAVRSPLLSPAYDFDVGAVTLRIVKQIHQFAALSRLKPTWRAWRSKVSSLR